jgi:hypothetical protein
MKVTMTTSKDYALLGEPIISTKGGARIRTSFWAPEVDQPPLLAMIENWHSDSVPLWVLASGARWVLTDIGLLDAFAQYDATEHLGGVVPGSFTNDFARLSMAKPDAPAFKVTP